MLLRFLKLACYRSYVDSIRAPDMLHKRERCEIFRDQVSYVKNLVIDHIRGKRYILGHPEEANWTDESIF